MKKYFYLFMMLIIGMMLSSCDTTETDPVDTTETGALYVTSNPSGATIFIDNVNRGTTPDTITGLSTGSHTIRLTLPNFADTSFTVDIVTNLITVRNVNLRSSGGGGGNFVRHTTRIWETTGTGPTEPSGLVLATGDSVSISGSDFDLYYYSSTNTFQLRSAHLSNSAKKRTYLKVGTSSDLNDGEESDVWSANENSWVSSVPDTETRYLFIYDANGHYSKLKFTRGGGTFSASYLDVEWLYNTEAGDTSF